MYILLHMTSVGQTAPTCATHTGIIVPVKVYTNLFYLNRNTRFEYYALDTFIQSQKVLICYSTDITNFILGWWSGIFVGELWGGRMCKAIKKIKLLGR